MIGIFDSWSGGLTFLSAMYSRFPQYDYLYLGDYDNCPYGSKTPKEIQKLTIIWVQKLFDAGAIMVILACNTASAWTLRLLQTQIFPDKIILWVTIPWAEKVIQLWLYNVTVFATQQTVNSKTYRERMWLLDAEIKIEEIALPGSLVNDIEALLPVQRCQSKADFKKFNELYQNHEWECNSIKWRMMTNKYFLSYTPKEAVILWCTHYPFLKKILQTIFPFSIFIDPSEESAIALSRYIYKHDINMSLGGEIYFL